MLIFTLNKHPFKVSFTIVTEFEYFPFFSSELRIAFNLFDKDKDGSISLQEVKSAMETLGQKVDHDKLRESFKQVDLDGECPQLFRVNYVLSQILRGFWEITYLLFPIITFLALLQNAL